MTIAQKLSFDVQLSDHARTAAEREQVLTDPGFGQTFTDHMISIDYTEGQGWHDARLLPYGPLQLDPATAVFHYAQELFEGLKAYRQLNGSIVTFRPYANATRFNRSAARMAMPELPEETFVDSLELLVQTDKEWVPTTEGHSLYLRPFMIATQAGLGVNYPSKTYKYMVIASCGGLVLHRRHQARLRLAVHRVHQGRPRRHRLRQVRRQLRRGLRRAAAGGGERLRPGGLAGRPRAPLRGGDGRDEPVLRLRRQARHPLAHRHPAARHHQGLDP